MTMVEFTKLKRSVTKNINLTILNQTLHVLLVTCKKYTILTY